jgi:hypothetical protein
MSDLNRILDPRLSRLMTRDPLRCASLSEYSAATGIELMTLMTLLGPLLDSGSGALEVVGEEVFLHTAPVHSHGTTGLPPNLWSTLRLATDPSRAHTLWSLLRTLERTGWEPVVDPAVIASALPRLRPVPTIALEVRAALAPLVHDVRPGLAVEELERIRSAGCAAAVVTCETGELDAMTTAVRRWIGSRRDGCAVMILEAPRFAPGPVLRPGDTSVRPASTSVLRPDPPVS